MQSESISYILLRFEIDESVCTSEYIIIDKKLAYWPSAARSWYWALKALKYTLNPTIGPTVQLANTAATRDTTRPRNIIFDIIALQGVTVRKNIQDHIQEKVIISGYSMNAKLGLLHKVKRHFSSDKLLICSFVEQYRPSTVFWKRLDLLGVWLLKMAQWRVQELTGRAPLWIRHCGQLKTIMPTRSTTLRLSFPMSQDP